MFENRNANKLLDIWAAGEKATAVALLNMYGVIDKSINLIEQANAFVKQAQKKHKRFTFETLRGRAGNRLYCLMLQPCRQDQQLDKLNKAIESTEAKLANLYKYRANCLHLADLAEAKRRKTIENSESRAAKADGVALVKVSGKKWSKLTADQKQVYQAQVEGEKHRARRERQEELDELVIKREKLLVERHHKTTQKGFKMNIGCGSLTSRQRAQLEALWVSGFCSVREVKNFTKAKLKLVGAPTPERMSALLDGYDRALQCWDPIREGRVWVDCIARKRHGYLDTVLAVGKASEMSDWQLEYYAVLHVCACPFGVELQHIRRVEQPLNGV